MKKRANLKIKLVKNNDMLGFYLANYPGIQPIFIKYQNKQFSGEFKKKFYKIHNLKKSLKAGYVLDIEAIVPDNSIIKKVERKYLHITVPI